MKLTLGAKDGNFKAYVDADWASQAHRHSISGYVVLPHESPIVWSAQKQTLIALLMAEAEYIALTSATREVLYLQSLLKELYERKDTPIIIHCNNQGAIALASNNKFHTKTKYIDIHYHFIQSVIKMVP